VLGYGALKEAEPVPPEVCWLDGPKQVKHLRSSEAELGCNTTGEQKICW
jgi:hypothetical protein